MLVALPRWSVMAPIVSRGDRRLEWSATNLSAGGLFVAGEPVLPERTTLEVDLILPGAFGPTLELSGRVQVVWTRLPRDARADRPCGMGMRFLDLSPAAQRDLEEYIAELARYQGADLEEIEILEILDDDDAPATTPLPQREPETLGRYRLLKRIGSGGMGDVFLAEHTILGRKVALKRLHPHFLHDRAAVRRFFDEGRLVNRVHHENVVEITDFVWEGDQAYFVMELLRGRTLTELEQAEGPLAVPRALSLTRQLCGALGAVHRAGVIHRDLKPDNVLVTNERGRPDFVKLLDFGIAKLRAPDPAGRRTAAGVIVGTPGFMAPEQLSGKEVDARCDIYALGVLLYQMITGRMPYAANTWEEMVLKQVTQKPVSPQTWTDVPAALERLILRCLARSPSRRPRDTDEVLACLQPL